MRGGGGCRLAQTSAVGYGLRPARDCARCSASRASSRGRRVAGFFCGPAAQRASRSSAGFARQPWPPARLAAAHFARRQPPPPRIDDVSSLGGKRLKCARAGERDVAPVAPPGQLAVGTRVCLLAHAHACGARGRVRVRTREARRPLLAPRRGDRRHLLRAPRMTLTLACASAFQCPFQQREETSPSGVAWGSGARSGERRGAQAARVAARSRPRSVRRAVRWAAEANLLRADLATTPWTPSTERSRAQAAGRSRPRTSERARPPRHPAPRSLRTRHAPRRQAASPIGEAPAPQAPHASTANNKSGGGGGSCDCAQDDRPAVRLLRLCAGGRPSVSASRPATPSGHP